LAEEDGFAAGECDEYIGTSAGSIVAAMLCAGLDPRSRLGELPEQPPLAESDPPASGSSAAQVLSAAAGLGAFAAGSLASLGLRFTEPGGRLLRRAMLGRVPRGRRSLAELGDEVRRSGVDWDGRLRISVVELETGRRVMLDGSSDPGLSVSDAVQASCAIPGVFTPVVVDGRSYVDGGAWSPTNLDVAKVKAGSRVLCLNPTGSLRASRNMPFGAFGPLSRSAAAIEASALRRRGAEVTVIAPDPGSATAMGANLMSARRREQVIAAGLAQGRRLAA
jgi:NTE family protein